LTITQAYYKDHFKKASGKQTVCFIRKFISLADIWRAKLKGLDLFQAAGCITFVELISMLLPSCMPKQKRSITLSRMREELINQIVLIQSIMQYSLLTFSCGGINLACASLVIHISADTT
jgi:hypothetical protein